MITQADAEDAIQWIEDNAREAAVAKATLSYMQEYRRVVKARLIHQAKGTVQEKESYALAHPDYEAHLDATRTAEEKAEEYRNLMLHRRAKWDAWRSQESSRRINI